MPVPKKKTSRSKRDMRRSHDGIKAPSVTLCPNCQEPKLPHRVCGSCGYYGDKEVIAVEEE